MPITPASGHNFRHGLAHSHFWWKYRYLSNRCNDEKNNRYERYGGRGIRCEWASFEDFRKDMYESYLKHVKIHGHKDTTIERVDSNGNYSKKNCRWATRLEQANNRSNNRFITHQGKTLTVSQWAREIGIEMKTLHRRIQKGWKLEKALTK